MCFTEPVECVRSYIERGGEKCVLLKVLWELFSERCTKKCRAFNSVIRNVIPQSILMCDYDDVSWGGGVVAINKFCDINSPNAILFQKNVRR